MEKVLVVGAGFMGSGIAQVSAQAGYRAHLMHIQAASRENFPLDNPEIGVVD